MQYKIIVDKQSRMNPSTDKKEYIINTEELRTNGKVSDSIIITKDEDYVLRKLSLSEYHVLKVLDEPIKEALDINIELFEGDNYIYLIDMSGNKFFAEYLIKNDFTDTYVTVNEMNSAINESAGQIELTVNQKLTGYSTTEEMKSAIDLKANSIKESVSKEYTTKDELATEKSERIQTANGINQTVSKKVGNDEIISKINQSAEEVGIDANKIELSAEDILNLIAGNTINLSGLNITISSKNLKIDKDGNLVIQNDGNTPSFTIKDFSGDLLEIYGPNLIMTYDYFGETVSQYLQKGGYYVENESTGESSRVWYNGIETPKLTQTSLAEQKKNFEKLKDNAIEILKDIDIYKYNLKSEKDTDKKHMGFVIGKDYNYSKEVTSIDNKGVDNYSFTSLCAKAIQEQQEQIEQLKQEINGLKEAVNGNS